MLALHVVVQPLFANTFFPANLANMRDTLHVDHLRVDLQGVQVGKRLSAILARVLKVTDVNSVDMHGESPGAYQNLAAMRTWVGFAGVGM